jgi:hypothetical protein
MKTVIQEVLLMTNTSFSKRQLFETRTRKSNDRLTPENQLEIACSNGLLYEMLPEINPATGFKEKLFLWSIETKKYFLRILIGTHPRYAIKESSLDPHIFLTKYWMN